jgi:hypothetical protein
MNTRQSVTISTLFFLLFGATPPPADVSIALVSKVIQSVEHKEAGGDQWAPAKRGEVLTSGERVKTGEKSIAVIKFKDNSMLRVRELTEVLLNGVVDGKAFLKSTEVQKGVIGFNIKKQQKGEEFRFSSPTSVASIRGTSGQFGATDSADKLVVLEGLVRLMNKSSSRELDVEEGWTGISYPSGKLEKRPSTPDERAAAQLAARLGDQTNTLDVELNNGSGNKKRIEIKFK